MASRLATVTGLLVFVATFTVLTSLRVVPLYMHDDYEYTYPSFSLVRAGDLGSPLMGTGLNIQHRTYNFTLYYYAAAHSVLIRLFGDRPESIDLANIFHFAALVACAAAFWIFIGDVVAGLVFVVAFASDSFVIAGAFAGRPEMTAAFGYFVAVLMLYAWQSSIVREPLALAGASTGAVLAALTHPAGVIALCPVFAMVIVLNTRGVFERRNITSLLAPWLVPMAIYGYFVATDDWRNIAGQMMGNGVSNIIWPKRYAMVASGRFTELLATVAPVWNHFSNIHFVYALPGILVGIAVFAQRHRLGDVWRSVRTRLVGCLFWSAAFFLSLIMHWLFLKDFVGSYTVIYRAAWYMVLAFSISSMTVPITRWFASRQWSEVYAGAVALVIALYVSSHDAAAVGQRLHDGFTFAHYDAFQSELSGALTAAGARPGDRVYCPSPFGTYLNPQFRPVTHGGERYADGLWPPSFDVAIEGKSYLSPESASLVYLKRIVFLNPQWIVIWDGDYSDLHGFMQFVQSFPDADADIRISQAGSYNSEHTYRGGIRIFSVRLNPAFSSALDRSFHVERRLESTH